jgi:hypothetical protein
MVEWDGMVEGKEEERLERRMKTGEVGVEEYKRRRWE